MNDQENYSQDSQHSYYDEKEEQKHKEKSHNDQLSSLVWALILIWAGLVFLGDNLGLMNAIVADPIQIGDITIRQIGTWSMIFLGAGVLVFVEGLIRTFVPVYRASTGSDFFLAAIFLGIGLGGLIGYSLVWPFILIAMGLATLASAMIRKRR